jgi:serine/threonine protein kinase
MSFTIGENVGAYRILEQLGQGGMATVYKAYHAALDRYVALKVLHPAFLEDKTFLARFEREAKLVAKLDHPNIVPIYDYSQHEGRPYLVMKYVEGETLKAKIQSKALDKDQVMVIVEAIGAGLTFAHKRGILHRDIKPSNVLLTTDNNIYIADFGLARIAQSGESTLSSDTILGTPQYISPEQALGKPNLDEGTDIYSFGVMLYELTVGRVPYSADTPFSVIHDHIYTPLPLPSSINPDISPDIERFLLKALAKDRADRFDDVPAMIDAFKQAWITGSATIKPAGTVILPSAAEAATIPPVPVPAIGSTAAARTVATPEPLPLPTDKKPKRLRWGLIAAGIALLLCCAVVFFAARSLRDNSSTNRQPNVAAPMPSIEATIESAIATGVAPINTPLPAQPSPQPNPMQIKEMTVREARQMVEKNPNDPMAHLQLAASMSNAGMPREAMDEVRMVGEIAKEDAAMLTHAADALKEKEAWLASALLYVRAAELYRDRTEPRPPALSDALHQSIYFAFEQVLAPEVIEYPVLSALEENLSLLAQARYAFFHRDLKQVNDLLADLEKMSPNMPEAKLLKAEVFIKNGRTVDARQALRELNNASGVPMWIQAYAKTLLKTLP